MLVCFVFSSIRIKDDLWYIITTEYLHDYLHLVPKWSSWSMWIQSGVSEFRFRVCLSHEAGSPGCDGRSIEERKCRNRRIGYCQSPFGKTISRKEHKCDGSNVVDYTKLGNLSNADWKSITIAFIFLCSKLKIFPWNKFTVKIYLVIVWLAYYVIFW